METTNYTDSFADKNSGEFLNPSREHQITSADWHHTNLKLGLLSWNVVVRADLLEHIL